MNIALMGAGAQGRVLSESCLRISGIRIAAICNIWEYSRHGLSGYPLPLHVFASGLYSLSPALIVRLRAKEFIFEVEPLSFNGNPSRLLNPSLSAASIQKVLFWLFVFCGHHPDVWALVFINIKNCELFNPQAMDGIGRQRSCS